MVPLVPFVMTGLRHHHNSYCCLLSNTALCIVCLFYGRVFFCSRLHPQRSYKEVGVECAVFLQPVEDDGERAGTTSILSLPCDPSSL
jgi:hypothetical protein